MARSSILPRFIKKGTKKDAPAFADASFCLVLKEKMHCPPITSNPMRAQRQRVAFEEEEQRNECALTFLIKKVGASDMKLAPTWCW